METYLFSGSEKMNTTFEGVWEAILEGLNRRKL